MKTSHTGVLPLVLSVLAADTSPLGMRYADLLAATKLGTKQLTSALLLLKKSGRCFDLGIHRDDRFYYGSVERREACRPAVDARLVVVQEQRRKANLEARKRQLNARRERMGLPPLKDTPGPRPKPKAEKQPKQAKPTKLHAPATVSREELSRKAWAAAKPVNPHGVKVTVCPGYVPRTFAPPPWFRGEYTTEWQIRRSSAPGGQPHSASE